MALLEEGSDFPPLHISAPDTSLTRVCTCTPLLSAVHRLALLLILVGHLTGLSVHLECRKRSCLVPSLLLRPAASHSVLLDP